MKEKLWVGLLITTCAAALWFGGKFFLSINNYLKFSEKTQAHIDRWEVDHASRKDYRIMATFHFEVNGRRIDRVFTFEKPVFLNKEAASHHLDELGRHVWYAWYAPGDPSTAKLQRFFSFKELIRFILCIGLVIYFFWLRRYVTALLEES